MPNTRQNVRVSTMSTISKGVNNVKGVNNHVGRAIMSCVTGEELEQLILSISGQFTIREATKLEKWAHETKIIKSVLDMLLAGDLTCYFDKGKIKVCIRNKNGG